MKKWLVAAGFLIILVGVSAFNSKFYYPPLPVEGLSKKEVVEKITHSEESLVKITEENEIEWFITNTENMNEVDELIKKRASHNGWVFKEKEGSGLFFENQGTQLIATTEQWTSDYVLVQIPSGFNDKQNK